MIQVELPVQLSSASSRLIEPLNDDEPAELVDDEPNLPTTYGVRGIPTMLLFKDGELKATKVGATSKSDLVSWLKENI